MNDLLHWNKLRARYFTLSHSRPSFSFWKHIMHQILHFSIQQLAKLMYWCKSLLKLSLRISQQCDICISLLNAAIEQM